MSMLNLLNAVTKCEISENGAPDKKVVCHYNPKDLTISSGARWGSDSTQDAKQAPPVKFLGTEPRKIAMTLLFDDSWVPLGLSMLFGGRGGVPEAVDQLFKWTLPTDLSVTQKKPTAPTLKVTWGGNKALSFDVYLLSVSAQYQEFSATGVPTRASVTANFTEIPSDPPRTNPSSGGVPGRRTHLVTAGDSLHSIAQREYGKPALWRGLASINGIDDPLRVPVGTSVLIPPREDAENFS